MGDLIVGVIVTGLAALAGRSLWKEHQAGKSCGCSGDCSKCRGCH